MDKRINKRADLKSEAKQVTSKLNTVLKRSMGLEKNNTTHTRPDSELHHDQPPDRGDTKVTNPAENETKKEFTKKFSYKEVRPKPLLTQYKETLIDKGPILDGQLKKFTERLVANNRYQKYLGVQNKFQRWSNEASRKDTVWKPKDNLEKIYGDMQPKKPKLVERQTETTDSDIRKFKKNFSPKRPVVKTITSQKDRTKIYKAVSFEKRKKLTPLQIKMPALIKKSKTSSVQSTSLSKASAEDKATKVKPVKKKKNFGRVISPVLRQLCPSPPTEVAKWAPSSINKYTKPYYEAWVDTTLAAISKSPKKEVFKQEILRKFKESLERRDLYNTPDYVCPDLTDERYTGRIRIKQRC